MDREKLKKMIQDCRKKLNKYPGSNYITKHENEFAIYYNIIAHTSNEIKDLQIYLKNINHKNLWIEEAITVLDYILEIIEMEGASEEKIEEGKIFQSAKEKLKEASLCFQREDYSSTINNLNTGLELLLKEKFDIPTTITKINTAKIIEIAIKHDLGPVDYLKQTKKYVSIIDNDVKHRGYKATKTDCVKALKSMEELSNKIEGIKITLTEEIRDKIYSGV